MPLHTVLVGYQVHGFQTRTVTEEEMIKGCIRSDRVAQKKLYDAFSPKMYPLCCRYVKDPVDAEDVLVTAFTHILDRINQYRGEGSLEGWIKRAVINESLSFLRKKKRMMILAEIEDAERELNGQEFHDPLAEEELLQLIRELPTGYRVVFNLYAIDGYSHKEIADQLHISENTSKSQLSRARNYLQKVLSQQHHSPYRMNHDIITR